MFSQVVFSPNGNYLNIVCEDYYFKSISTRDMKPGFSYKNNSLLNCCANLTDTLVLVGDQMGRVLLFEVTKP